MKFRKFTKPQFLKNIGRTLLDKLFGKYAGDLVAAGKELPAPDANDDAYFKSLSGVAMMGDGLPDDLFEAMYAIEEMANEEGQERLENAPELAALGLKFDEKSSRGDIALQVFLAAPELLAKKHNEMRLSRLASFEYHGCKTPQDRSASFKAPTKEVLERLTADLDEWFKQHHRGEKSANIDPYELEGEFWFLVRHGDAMARMAKLDKGKLKMLHFRPAKDDVVVYSPQRDEIRIHAGTKGEKELYRTAFGSRLQGNPDYFSERKAYTLDPLRTDGPDALSVDGVPEIEKIVLTEFELQWRGGLNDSLVKKSNDIFTSAKAREKKAIPDSGNLVRAGFDFYFEGVKKPRKVQIRPWNTLKLGRHCDARPVHEWLSKRGFRTTMDGNKTASATVQAGLTTTSGDGTKNHAEVLAMS